MVKIQDFFLSSTHMYQRMPRLEDVVVAIKFLEIISLQRLLLEGFSDCHLSVKVAYATHIQ